MPLPQRGPIFQRLEWQTAPIEPLSLAHRKIPPNCRRRPQKRLAMNAPSFQSSDAEIQTMPTEPRSRQTSEALATCRQWPAWIAPMLGHSGSPPARAWRSVAAPDRGLRRARPRWRWLRPRCAPGAAGRRWGRPLAFGDDARQSGFDQLRQVGFGGVDGGLHVWLPLLVKLASFEPAHHRAERNRSTSRAASFAWVCSRKCGPGSSVI